MAQAFYCPGCAVSYTAKLRGESCPACGEELIHGRIPAGRRSSMRRREGSTGKAMWDHIIRKDPCAYCSRLPGCSELTDPNQKKVGLHTIDHIQPKALGGSKGSWTNRIGSCRPCNADKAHTPLLFFMLQELGEDISALLDEEGRWPLPPEGERAAEEVIEIDMTDARNTLVRLRGHDLDDQR